MCEFLPTYAVHAHCANYALCSVQTFFVDDYRRCSTTGSALFECYYFWFLGGISHFLIVRNGSRQGEDWLDSDNEWISVEPQFAELTRRTIVEISILRTLQGNTWNNWEEWNGCIRIRSHPFMHTIHQTEHNWDTSEYFRCRWVMWHAGARFRNE